ncbi:hypothetical protein BZA70DRAFT_180267 [Myxozyma melibiosi]|uniref:Uncharacterized protein n=1 Tax=Myxozyma melibiosi TaxID=54550 RepID=A0ABR1F4C3_9ASCO
MESSKFIVLTDFDETITESDTLSLVAAAAYDANPIPEPWSDFGAAYMADYASFMKTYRASQPTPDTVSSELAMQAKLDAIERRSVERVERSGLFKGVTRQHLAKQAEQARVRAGVPQVLRAWKKCSAVIGIGVISVNWSAWFIEQVLRESCGVSAKTAAGVGDWDAADVVVHANEIEMDELGRGTGKLQASASSGLRSGPHKESLLKKIASLNPDANIIYLGDSTTDLAPLLSADLGIIVGNKSSLREVCTKIGVDVKPLSAIPLTVARDRGAAGMTYKTVLYALDQWQDLLRYGPLSQVGILSSETRIV